MENEELRKRLKELSLRTMASIFEEEAKKAGKLKLSYTDFLAKLVEEEHLSRCDRSVAARIAKAKFPFVRTIEEFDFSFQPSLSPQYIKELGKLSFTEKAENIVFLGLPGTGKTHLSVAIGVRACMARKRVLFFLLSELLDLLVAAKISGTLGRKLSELSRIDLLICDEIGYVAIDRERANLFFQLVAKRYERGSIILNSNKTFEEWGEIFYGDEVVASGLLDRLLHHSHIIAIDGPSYRTKDKKASLKKKKAQLENGNEEGIIT
jgi:DNA replication protein DnaC